MIDTFSVRYGITKPISLDREAMPDELRNRLWNATDEHINNFGKNRTKFIEFLWDDFFGQAIYTLRRDGYADAHACIDQIREKFYAFNWYKLYNFIEFLLKPDGQQNFIDDVNHIFTTTRAPYKIIGNLVTLSISGIEAEEVEKALETKYSTVSEHIKKALSLYNKRPTAHYQNSITESIGAIEALAEIILDKPKATLGKLADQLNIHPAFKEAIKKLYGWTSDEGGMRHGDHGEELKSAEEEARYMLVQCSALVNYVIAKHES